MEPAYLIDTNVLIDAQTKNLPSKGLKFLAEIIDKNFIVSFISYIEFLGYKEATKANEEFIALANVISIDGGIINRCISLRKNNSIKLPDAIIAATAIEKNLVLATRNISDFKDIEGLSLLNLWEV